MDFFHPIWRINRTGYVCLICDQRENRTKHHCTNYVTALQLRSYWSLRISRLSKFFLLCWGTDSVILSLVSDGRTHGNGTQLSQGTFILDMRKSLFTMRVSRHWHRLPSEVVDAPGLSVVNLCRSVPTALLYSHLPWSSWNNTYLFQLCKKKTWDICWCCVIDERDTKRLTKPQKLIRL